MSETKGSCHCGNVRYSVRGDFVSLVNCHCTLCRSLSGSAFASYAVARESDFSLQQGQGSIANYKATDKTIKHFCSDCGTPIYNSNPVDYPSLVILYLGSLAANADLTPKINLFCESKLPWVDRVSSIKGFPREVVRGA